MPVEHRRMRPEDEDAVLGLWAETWSWGGLDRQRHQFHLTPAPHKTVFVAVDSGAPRNPLATVRYMPRGIRDAAGTPRLVGCVSHVVTREEARRQGHAARLMTLAMASMRQEGCDWTLLFSSDMGVPVYTGLGYKHYSAPYREGVFSGQLPANPQYYTILHTNLTGRLDDIELMPPIYSTYNAARPLSFVRDKAYWRGMISYKLTYMSQDRTVTLLTAHAPGENGPVAYLQTHLRTGEAAREQSGLDKLLTLAEAGSLPGHTAALPALISAAVRDYAPNEVAIRAFLPYEEPIDTALTAILAGTLHERDDRSMMARPISPFFSQADLDATFAAPGAFFYAVDEF